MLLRRAYAEASGFAGVAVAGYLVAQAAVRSSAILPASTCITKLCGLHRLTCPVGPAVVARWCIFSYAGAIGHVSWWQLLLHSNNKRSPGVPRVY